MDLSSGLARKQLITLIVESGGAVQVFVKSGSVLMDNGTIAVHGAGFLGITTGSVITEIILL